MVMKEFMHRIGRLAVRLASAAYTPTKLSLALWFSALGLALAAPALSNATVTYIVGTCKSGTQFSTIQSALDASPSPNIVEVCPGQYAEQITINHPVTLEGITASNGAQARIVIPPGFAISTTLNGGAQAAAQIFVNHVSGGAVNVTNFQVNGLGNSEGGTFVYFIGVLYQDSSGTIKQVITSNQDGANVIGFGMWVEGGSSNPSVTVEGCSVHDFTDYGIYATGTQLSPPNLTATLKNNLVSSVSEGLADIVADVGTNPSISANTVNGGTWGIFSAARKGSITGNTVLGSQTGIQLDADGPSVMSNNIFDTVKYGIAIGPSALTVSKIQNNNIKSVLNPGSGGGTGIELECESVDPGLVSSNTIMDASYGYGDAPAGFAGSNTYLGVLFEIATCQQ
jgi:Periplasmic copper-binding protein (NosD)